MAITDYLRSAQGGALVAELARAHSISPEQAAAVIDAVVPKLSERIERNTLSRGGLADLVNALGHGHHEAYVDDPRLLTDEAAREDGNAILGHILGTKDKSRAIADNAAALSGVAPSIIKMMLPVIAGMFMGGLSKQVKSGLGGILGRMGGGPPDGSTQRIPQGGNGMPDLSQLPDGGTRGGSSGGWGQQDSGGVRTNSGGGLEMPDTLPDYPSQGGGRGGTPLPLPGNRVPGMPGNAENPYGDLADILRRGFGLPGGGGGGGPIIIPIPGGGGGGFPWPSGGQPRGQQAPPQQGGEQGGFPWPEPQQRPQQRPQPQGQDGGFPWPQPGGGRQGGGQGLPMPQEGGGGFPWPQGGGNQGGGLPLPQGNGRGIELPGGNVGGGMLWTIVRQILGGALGFQSKGIMGWLFRMIIMKFGWQILRTILGRGLFGR